MLRLVPPPDLTGPASDPVRLLITPHLVFPTPYLAELGCAAALAARRACVLVDAEVTTGLLDGLQLADVFARADVHAVDPLNPPGLHLHLGGHDLGQTLVVIDTVARPFSHTQLEAVLQAVRVHQALPLVRAPWPEPGSTVVGLVAEACRSWACVTRGPGGHGALLGSPDVLASVQAHPRTTALAAPIGTGE